MPTADSWDAETANRIARWVTTGENAKAKEKDRFAAQKDWLIYQIDGAQTIIDSLSEAADTALTTYTNWLKRYSVPLQEDDYLDTDDAIISLFGSHASAIVGGFVYELDTAIGALSSDTIAQWVAKLNKKVNQLKAPIKSYQVQISAAKARLQVWQEALEQLKYTGVSLSVKIFTQVAGKWKAAPGTTSGGKWEVAPSDKGLLKLLGDKNQEFVYNVSGVVDSYFSGSETFTYELNNRKYNVMGNNVPAVVSSARELWSTSAGHKGMISSINYKEIYGDTTDGEFSPKNPIVPHSTQRTTDDKGKVTTTSVANTNVEWVFDLDNHKRYAFQFLYNPGTVDMTFMGTPDVDVGYEISGSDQFSLIGGMGITQSTITFDLILNRMFDMKYYDPNTEHLKSPFRESPEKVYPGRVPTVQEQQLIYRRGTMYDLDYLLRTLLGYKGPTTLRFGGSDKTGVGTADIGYLGAMPVELHLGQNLRYLGIVNGLTVRHVVFNERMVPLFSTLHVQFNRIPDFPTK